MLLATSSLSAQKMQEVIYLKNGSIIKGTVIEQVPNEFVKIRTRDGSIYVYPIAEVVKITKESSSDRFSRVSDTHGYKAFVDFALTAAGGVYDVRAEFVTSHGYRIDPYIYAGMGVGLHYYRGSRVLIPVFVDGRVSFLDGPISPFINLRTGYSFKVSEKMEGGFYISPMFGVRFVIGESIALNLAAGYSFQNIKVDYYSNGQMTGLTTDGFTLRLGLEL